MAVIMTMALIPAAATDAALPNTINLQAKRPPDISGTWCSNYGVTYWITQQGPRFSWQDDHANPEAAGTIQGESLTVTWISDEASHSVTGQMKEFDSSGRPQQIIWNNGIIFGHEAKGHAAKQMQGWCCYKGEVFPAEEPECLERGGRFFRTREEAEELCHREKPEPERGWCCLDGKVYFVSESCCAELGGRFYRTREEAEEFCRTDVYLMPEEVRPFQKADLAIISVSAEPEYPMPGEQATVQVDVLNRSERDYTGLKLALLVDGQITDVKRIDMDERSKARFHFNWRPNRTKVYNLRAVLDPDEDLAEVSRHDNSLAEEFIVSERPSRGANFAIINIRWIEQEDRPPIPQITVKNNGDRKAQVPLALRDKKGKVKKLLIGPIEPGAQVTVDGPEMQGRPRGELSAEINPRFRSIESDPGDNVKIMQIQLPGDLAIEKLTFHERKEGSTFSDMLTVSFRIVNEEAEDIQSPFQTSIKLKGGGFSGGYNLSSSGLASGETLYVSRTFKRPTGAFDVEVEVDSGRSLFESREDNNVARWHFTGTAADIGRWVSIGPRRIDALGHLDSVGRLYHAVIDPINRSTIYIGVISPYGDKTGSGIWKTTDGGVNWYPVGDSLDSCAISALALDSTNPSRLYALTPVGLYRTDDGGTSWRRIYYNALQLGKKLIVNAKNPNRLVSRSTQGIFLSTDGGKNWYVVLTGGDGDDLVEDPDDPNRLYAALYHKTDFEVAGIYKSINGGDDWHKLSGCPGGELPEITEATGLTLAASKDTVYVGYKKKGKFRLYRTTDPPCKKGSLYERPWEAAWSTSNPISEVRADPKNPKYVSAYFEGGLFYLSTNGGSNFSAIEGKHPHVDQHGVFYDPVDTKIVYAVNDGGVYRSDNHGKKNTWDFIGEGICNVEFYDIAISKTDPSLVIGGTQDNGTIRYDGQTTHWKEFHGGDGATCAIDPANSKILYFMNQFPESLRYMAGSSKHKIGSGLPSGDVFGNMYFQLHPGKPDILLACAGALYRKDKARSSGSSWKKIYIPAKDEGNVYRVGVDASADLYYVGTGGGRLHAGPEGTNWREVFRHPHSQGIRDIEIDPNRPRYVYITCGGRDGSVRLYRLYRDAIVPLDKSNMPAQAIAGGIPDGLLINTVAVDRTDLWTVYAGTSKGVYRGRSDDGGQSWTWEFFNTGIPAGIDIIDLEVHPTTGVIRAATMGRGAYELHPGQQIGSQTASLGKITSIRLHDVGTGYGPPNDRLDADVIVLVDNLPNMVLGFQLRKGQQAAQQRALLKTLRYAFQKDLSVRIVYKRTGFRIGIIQRVTVIQ